MRNQRLFKLRMPTQNIILLGLLIGLLPIVPSFALHNENQQATDCTIEKPTPNPKWSAAQVIEIHLRAMQNNDQTDSGIATSYQFASPVNKAYTGSLERYTFMVKNTSYAHMLNFQFFQVANLVEEGNRARQVVQVFNEIGEEVVFLFELSKQVTGELKGCWMIDTVKKLDVIEVEDIKTVRT